MNYGKLGLGLLIALFLTSCNKESENNSEPIPINCDRSSYEDVLDCHNRVDWRTEDLVNSVLGSWEWQYHWRFDGTNFDSSSIAREHQILEIITALEIVVVEQMARDTLECEIRQTLNGSKLGVDDDEYKFLNGRFFICGDELIITSYYDPTTEYNWYCRKN